VRVILREGEAEREREREREEQKRKPLPSLFQGIICNLKLTWGVEDNGFAHKIVPAGLHAE
jgi:hypothetical protein